VKKVNWYRREIIFSGTMALMLIAVLSAVSYLISPQTEDFQIQYVFQTPETHAFTLTVSNASSESPTLENRTIKYDMIDWLQLEYEFTFSGHIYPIHEPSNHGKTTRIGPEYHGEFNATPLQSIDIELYRIFIDGFSPENMTYLEIYKNITISASLRTTENVTSVELCKNIKISPSQRTTQIFDLGVRTSINEKTKLYDSNVEISIQSWMWSATGFWQKNNAGGWFISVDQLSNMLQGNGTAVITFNATINTRIKYELRNENMETSEVTLPQWEGRLGTIEIVYEQGKITWVRYSFYRASITILSAS
jgi:hypothetical protein